MWLRRAGVDVLVETRWRRRVEADAWEADGSGFLKNEQSIFPYQISFPDEPQMQFLSCPWGDLYRGLFVKVAHTSFPSDS